MVTWFGRKRSTHARHLAEARRWRRASHGTDWHLAGVTTRGSQRVYVWVKRIPGSKRYRYVALQGIDASMAMLHLLTVAKRQHEAAIDSNILDATQAPAEMPGNAIGGIMMV